jgi:hypothetical protein
MNIEISYATMIQGAFAIIDRPRFDRRLALSRLASERGTIPAAAETLARAKQARQKRAAEAAEGARAGDRPQNAPTGRLRGVSRNQPTVKEYWIIWR